ncbi:MAG: DUF438 domain-containing protein [Deltaproteobacteria bacterium]|nr:DUF438 domain-containing protein [Deltaproteobacteria bacterium]MBN2671426.1 DUF438 domain-containing protein [Deltaproteobacteria bacterium]
MNELIKRENNVSRFKEILLELHRGVAPDKLYDRFHDVISAANVEECKEIQKQLIIEGVPKRRAKNWGKTHMVQTASN